MPYVRNSLCFLVLYWLAFQSADLVGLNQHVSAFYPAPAVSIAFIAIFGIRYLPVFAVGVLISTSFDAPFWFNGITDYLMALRQFAVYGITGIILNRYFEKNLPIRSPKDAFTFIFFALGSTLFSSLLARAIFQHYKVFPNEIINEMFVSFWVGDLSGVIVFGPLMFMFMDGLKKNEISDRLKTYISHQNIKTDFGIVTIVVSIILIFAVSNAGSSHFRFEELAFIPIILGASRLGFVKGYLSALIANILLVFTIQYFGGVNESTIDLQFFFIMLIIVAMIVGVEKDGRQLAEKEVIDSEAGLAKAQRLAHIGNWAWDIASGKIVWSDETFRIFGHEPGSFSASYEKFIEAVHPDDRDAVQMAVARGLNATNPYAIEHRIILPDGDERYVAEQGEAVFDEAGKPVSMNGTVQDITERKLAENNLKETHDHIQKVLEASPAGFAVSHPESGFIEYANNQLAAMIRLPMEQFIGLPASKFYDNSNDRDEVINQIQREGSVANRQILFHRADGSTFWGLMTIKTTMYQGESRFFTWIHDVTELKEALKAAEKANSEIIRFGRLVEINEMGSAILHEINTPIQTASSTAYLGLIDYNKGTATLEGMAGSLKDIQDALGRVGEVEDHIRKFLGGERSKLEATDVNKVINESVNLLDSSLSEKQTRVRLDLRQDLPEGMADAVELEQVLINLIKNACEAVADTPPENREITVSSEMVKHHKIKVEVSDKGVGVPEDIKEKIFDSFNTTKSSGVGMGLSICRSIMESFGGSIEVVSDGQNGSSFILLFPAAQSVG